MDELQGDIDALEKEKAEMKKRLDAYSKKTLLADLARHASSSSSIAAVVAGKKRDHWFSFSPFSLELQIWVKQSVTSVEKQGASWSSCEFKQHYIRHGGHSKHVCTKLDQNAQ